MEHPQKGTLSKPIDVANHVLGQRTISILTYLSRRVFISELCCKTKVAQSSLFLSQSKENCQSHILKDKDFMCTSKVDKT